MEDLISIVLPVYNGERFLRASIDSIINQTYQNWELIVVDDCSTDHTAEIVAEYVKCESRIHYYRNEKNLRLPRNLNRGFSLTKGNYLTWTSDDNKYRPDALEKMLLALKKNADAQFVFASCRVIDENDREIEYISVSKKSRKAIVGSNPVGACFMYTRKVYEEIGDYDPEYTLVEDFDYWQRIFAKFDVVTIEEILYDYRWHSNSLTSTLKQEELNCTIERMLLKNRQQFGKLDAESKYFYYAGLYKSRQKQNALNNPYKWKYYLYAPIFVCIHRVESKIRRTFCKQEL